jgi:uncharacterized protein (DUF1697 family)
MARSVYVALLRAVNLGGATKVGMAPLREHLARAGFPGVQSILQSGNLVFGAEMAAAGRIEQRLEAELVRGGWRATEVFVRSAEEWASIVSKNPYPREAEQDPAHLLVMLLKDAPPPNRWTALGQAIRGPERTRGDGRTAYLVYPDGVGTSKLTPAVIERALGTRGTMRNWNTVRKLQETVRQLQVS